MRVGRGFATGDENKHADQPIGVIAIDSIFSPVTRVKYAVDNTRVGQRTDYDKLILEVWTDGRITPEEALLQSSAILRHHLDVFVNYDDDSDRVRRDAGGRSEENTRLQEAAQHERERDRALASAPPTASTTPTSPPSASSR